MKSCFVVIFLTEYFGSSLGHLKRVKQCSANNEFIADKQGKVILLEFERSLAHASVHRREQHLPGIWWCKVTALTHPTIGDHPDPNGQRNAPPPSSSSPKSVFLAVLCCFLDLCLSCNEGRSTQLDRRTHRHGL